MGILTSQKIASYYELFKTIEVTFSKEIIQVTGLIPNQIFLKCVGDFWPCVIFSTSFQGARVVVNTKSGILQKLERANNIVSLRFCFKVADKGNPVTFFINSKSTGFSAYGNSSDMAVFNLQFTQRPPDDLIEIMGRILDANVNSAKRKDERIPITPESARRLNLAKESSVFIQGVPRHCILRDVSFSGVKIIMMGVAKFLVDREAVLKMDFEDPRETFLLKGKFIRSEAVEGRKELVSLALNFDENIIPMAYKIRVNDYISQMRPGEKPAAGGAPKAPVPLQAEAAPVPPPPQKAENPAEAAGAAGGAVPSTGGTAAAPPGAQAKTVPSGGAKPSGDDAFDLQLPS